MSDHDGLPIVIVGGGFSGTLLAINLVRLGACVVLIERDEAALGKGLAFGTRRSEHLLNVRASNMSAFPDDPHHFLRWMGFGDADQSNRFVPRLAYGQYLREVLIDTLAEAGARFSVTAGEAIDVIENAQGGARVVLRGGEVICGRAVVLALGNLPTRCPAPLAGLPADLVVSDPWRGAALADIGHDDPVLLVGTGLTAIDVVLSLDNMGHRGFVLALSRRGLRPRSHAAEGPEITAVDRPRERGAALIKAVRRRAAAAGWRKAVDELRPHTKALWQAHDHRGQSAFLRHLRAWWDVHRHRLAPHVDGQVARAEQDGRLAFRAGRLLHATARGDRVEIRWRPRGTCADMIFSAARIINCSGPEGDIGQCRDALLRRLLERGKVRADAHRLGLDVDARWHVIDAEGRPHPRLFAVGPLTKGAVWEIVAVPDIRQQVWDLARRLCRDSSTYFTSS